MRSADQELLATIIANGSIWQIESSISKGANLNAQDYRSCVRKGYEGFTPLHYASNWRSKNHKRKDLVELILRSKGDPNIQSKYGHSPLHNFSIVGDDESILLLLQNGAKINCFNKSGDTPLHYSCRFGHLSTVRMLLEWNASVNAFLPNIELNQDGKTPLHSAVQSLNIEVVKLLVRHGANPTLATLSSRTKKETPLQYAIDHERLIKHGYNPSEEDRAASQQAISSIIEYLKAL
ncbi:ankyrin repeat domain-containing protein [Maritalea sp. S77]|uniref:ankyrin repeat domain-containing protein n=1 Tax=Maritalea sp. S77 TaxID=3415125 RepID=UPI003C7A7E83